MPTQESSVDRHTEAPVDTGREDLVNGRKCPRCGHTNPPDANFCTRCGVILPERMQ